MVNHAVVSTTISRSVDSFYGPTIDELRARGYRVHVVTSPGPEIARLQRRADEVHLVKMSRKASLIRDLAALTRWVLLLRRIGPSVVIAGTPKAGLLGMVAAKMARVPNRAYLLQGLRLEGTKGPRRLLLGCLERVTSRCSHRVIAVSPSLASEYVKLGLNAGRPVVIPHHGSSHGVDTLHFLPKHGHDGLIEDLGLDPTRPLMVFVGRLTEDKGPDTLIKAWSHMAARGESAQLLVVGAQDERDSAIYIQRLKAVSTDVRILDHLKDVRPYIGAADVLILPTLREGLPNVVLEAAAMEVPAITTTATGAVDSVVDGITGLLVPPGDPLALADAAARILRDDFMRDRMGKAARQRVVNDFQPVDVASDIVNHSLGRKRDLRVDTQVGRGRVVVVTGASGFIGRSLVPYLRSRDYQVIPVGRSEGMLSYTELAGGESVPRGAAYVHLAGKAHDLSGTDAFQEYRAANAALTGTVWRSAVATHADSFCFVSSIKAAVDSSDGPVSERVTPTPVTPYGKSKLEAETILRRESKDALPNLTILRPVLVYGPGVKGNLKHLKRLVSLRFPYPFGGFDNRRSLLSVENLCFVIERIVAGTVRPDLYNVADPEPISTVQLVRLIADGMGRRVWVLAPPEAWIRRAVSLLSRSGKSGASDQLEKLTGSLVVDTSKLAAGLAPDRLPYSTAEGIMRFAMGESFSNASIRLSSRE